MTEADPLRRYVEAGMALTQLTRAWAEAMVKDLVKAGDVQREHAQDRVEELVDRSRKGTEAMVGLIRKEIANQLSALGFATKDDLQRMEQRMSGAGEQGAGGGSAAAAAKKGAPKRSPAKKAAAKKAAAKKAAAKTSPAKTSAPTTAAPKKAAATRPAARRGGGARGAAAGQS
ncbi:MAG: phasin family protein [Acidimicrobiales bacterium]